MVQSTMGRGLRRGRLPNTRHDVLRRLCTMV